VQAAWMLLAAGVLELESQQASPAVQIVMIDVDDIFWYQLQLAIANFLLRFSQHHNIQSRLFVRTSSSFWNGHSR
jgi:hypothetical protein